VEGFFYIAMLDKLSVNFASGKAVLLFLNDILNVIDIVDPLLSFKLYHTLHRRKHFLALLIYLTLVCSIIEGRSKMGTHLRQLKLCVEYTLFHDDVIMLDCILYV
jgi:hypothetical protein